MGSERRSSESRRAVRLSLPVKDRETLVPCPACEGHGQVMKTVEEADRPTRYRMVGCKWCAGVGAMDHRMLSNLIRWMRIWNRNKAAGRCPAKSVAASFPGRAE